MDLINYTKEQITELYCELLLVYGSAMEVKEEYLIEIKDYIDKVFFPQVKGMISEKDKSLLTQFKSL